MPKTTDKTKSTRRSERGAGKDLSPDKKRTRRCARSHKKPRASSAQPDDYLCVMENGAPAYVLVPIEEYEQLVKESMAAYAIAQIESGDEDFVDADDLRIELAAERLVKARKAAGLTQKQLGAKLNLPQSRISHIERNPDRTTIRTLRRIARALRVDVSALI